MAALQTGAILVLLSVFPGAERVWGQRAPCYQCEDYKENHPQTSPYQQIRSHCIYPCECEDREPTCPPEVSVIRDGCGCCLVCASQLGQPCDGTSVCDERKGLICHYPFVGAAVGVCQATTGLPCMVSNKTYNHGETFHMDCRTQCSCQNGTYACSSLCPNENISPRGACTHPRLVEVPDQCCREWMCDSTEAEHPPVCKQEFTSWSPCSAACGLGVSQRISNLNQDCILRNETRMCQLRPCEVGMLSLGQHARHHHIRKGHECKATQRVSGPVRLRFGPCRSKKRYRPKFCGSCDDKVGDGCCTPQLSTTIKVEFICDSVRRDEDPGEILLDLIEPGRDLWWPDDLLAIGKQTTTSSPGRDTTDALDVLRFESGSDDFDKFRKSLGWNSRKSPVYPKKYPGKYWTKEDVFLLSRRNKSKESEFKRQNSEGVDLVTLSTGNVDDESYTKLETTQQITTEFVTTETTTAKPKKKRKKKPRKAFTSWLEFRDEEYQMDEYEDDDSADQNRRKRNVDGEWNLGGKVVKRTHRDGNENERSRPAEKDPEDRQKRHAGSFREGHLEESHDEDYDDDEKEDDDEDEEEDDEDDEDDDDDDKTPDEKPLYYAFNRRKRGTSNIIDYKSLEYTPKSLQFMTAQEKMKKKKLKKEGGKYKNQIERKSNLLKKIMMEEKEGRNSKKSDRVFTLSQWKEMEKHNQDVKKRKLKGKEVMKKRTEGAGRKEQKVNQRNDSPRRNNEQRSDKRTGKSRTIESRQKNVKTLSKLERIVQERNNTLNNASSGGAGGNKTKRVDANQGSVTRRHNQMSVKKEPLFHTAGKVHKSRTKRHAPRPPWGDEDGIESEDLTWGDHSVSFSVQWIVKCRCDRDCGVETTTAASELSNDGEIILRRVHRTAPP